MPILYCSQDNGQLYTQAVIEHDWGSDSLALEHFDAYEVPEQISFTPDQLCVVDGSIMEALLGSGQAKKVQP